MRQGLLSSFALLVFLSLVLLDAGCQGRVHRRDQNGGSLHPTSEVAGPIHRDPSHRADVSKSSTASYWRILASRLRAVLHMTGPKSAQSPDTAPHSDTHLSRARRSYDADEKVAQEQVIADDISQVEERYGKGRKVAEQREIAREIEQIERDAGVPSDDEKLAQEQVIAAEIKQIEHDAGVPSDDEKLAQEEEIAAEVKQIEERYGPEHKIAQQREIAREIETAEIEAGRADADRRFEQQREIQREIEEIERKAGVPSEAEKLEQEREIARQIEAIEAKVRERQFAQEQMIADDIHAVIKAHLSHIHPPDSPYNDVSSSEESDESNDVSNGVDDDPIYDDAFGDDSSLLSPLNEDGDDDDLWSSDDSLSSPETKQTAINDVQDGRITASSEQIQLDGSAPGGAVKQTSHSSWQVTVMTVIMCSIVGIVLLIVVGAWYRDLGYRSLRPGKPEQLLLDDDETVYNRTTQPEPRQVGTYSQLT